MLRAATTIFSFVLVFTSCDDSRILPKSTGTAGELLVVMDGVHWEGEPGKALKASFQQWIKGLPQREHRFTLVNFSHAGFSGMLNSHRNIILAEIGTSVQKAEVRKEFEHWSKDQLLVQIVAPDVDQWLSVFNQQAEQISDLFDTTERARIQKSQVKLEDAAHGARTEKHFGVNVKIPKDFIMVDGNDEFMHFRRDWAIRSRTSNGPDMSHNVIDGVFVYSYPYTSDSTFTRDALMDMRDSRLREYVAGPTEGSYMATQRFFQELDLRPSMKAVTLDSEFATEMRGLWGMVGAKMGGPFISVSFVNKERNAVVAVEGYVYAPQFDKREFLRYIDAIVYSTTVSQKQLADPQD